MTNAVQKPPFNEELLGKFGESLKRSSMKITFLVAENCLASGISGLIDTFTIANLWQMELTGSREPLFTTELVSVDGKPVVSNGCIHLIADKSIHYTENAEYIILPPFLPVPEPNSPDMRELKHWIVNSHGAGTPIAAICTGSFLLAETGLLNGREATTNWQFARKFNRRYPKVRLRPEKIITEDNGLICTGAATSNFNFGLALIEKYGSRELAGVCSKALLIDPNRTSQAPYFMEYTENHHTDTAVAKAQRFFETNYAQITSIDQIAQHVCLSPRHFKRRFKKATGDSPLSYLQNIRVELAKKKLESTLDSIDEITQQIGYENSSTFRRLFKRYTSLSPREYRDKFARRSL